MSTLFASDPAGNCIDCLPGPPRRRSSKHGWSIRRHALTIINPPAALVSFAALGGLLVYLIIRQLLDPGYTKFLGYMVIQDSVAILFLLWLGWWLAPESQISRLTYLLVVAEVWSDSLGNAVHLYSDHPEYDKITHLGGGMAISAVAADLLFGIQRKHGRNWSYKRVILGAAAISMTFCIGWELYEYFGDRLINSSRWKGWEDTNGDLVADFLGVLVVLTLMFVLDPNHLRTTPYGHHLLREGGGERRIGGVTARPATISRLRSLERAHIRQFLNQNHQREILRTHQGDFVRIGLWTGIVAPVAAFVLIGMAALMTPSYRDFSNTISDLADQGQPQGYLVQIDMFIFGLATTAFGLALSAVLPRWRLALGVLFTIFGLSISMAGLFRDYGQDPSMPHNREGFVHNTFGVIAVIAIGISMIATTSIASRSPEWRSLLLPSFAGIFLISASGLLFLWGPVSLQGLLERVIYLSAGIWMMVAADVALRTKEMSPDRPITHHHVIASS